MAIVLNWFKGKQGKPITPGQLLGRKDGRVSFTPDQAAEMERFLIEKVGLF